MSEQVLVTGGAGFIGSHLVERLVKDGKSVRVLDNFISGKDENLSEVKNDIEIIKGDIRDLNIVRQSVKGCTLVFHQAALRSVPKSVDNPALTNDVNIQGTLNVLMSSRDENVRRVVYASSSSAYGETNIIPETEDISPNPVSPYAVSKLAGEHYCRVFSAIHGLFTVSLRYFNVFGPRQDPESMYSTVVPKFIQQAIRNEPFEIHSDGLQSRDFTYVSNVVNANIAASRGDGISGEYFNIACGKTTSIKQVADIVARILNKPARYNYTPRRAGDVRMTQADITKAKNLLAYEADVELEDGLKKTIDFLVKNPHRL